MVVGFLWNYEELNAILKYQWTNSAQHTLTDNQYDASDQQCENGTAEKIF